VKQTMEKVRDIVRYRAAAQIDLKWDLTQLEDFNLLILGDHIGFAVWEHLRNRHDALTS